MKKFKKLFISLFSCVIIIGSLAALSACGGSGSGSGASERKISTTDPVLGSWYAELPDIPGMENQYGFVSKGDGGYYNIKTYIEVTYTEGINGAYRATVETRYFDNHANGQIAAYNSVGGSFYIKYANIDLENNQYYVLCYLGVGTSGISNLKSYYIFTLVDNTLTAVPYNNEGDTVTFTRTSMTLDEFDALDLTYDPSDYDNYPW